MTDQLEQWLARLERRIEQLSDRLSEHAEAPVHAGFADVLKGIQRSLQTLETRWIQVGSAVIMLLVSILIALIGVLWTILHGAPVAAPPH